MSISRYVAKKARSPLFSIAGVVLSTLGVSWLYFLVVSELSKESQSIFCFLFTFASVGSILVVSIKKHKR